MKQMKNHGHYKEDALRLENEMKERKFSNEKQSLYRHAFVETKKEALKEAERRLKVTDFECLAVVGKGAFGEVKLVRERKTREVYALKSMMKENMIRKNQVSHVLAERQLLTEAHNRSSSSEWIVTLHYSFQDAHNLYMVLDFLPGGDLMGLLIEKDLFSEAATRQYACELVLAVSAVHALGKYYRTWYCLLLLYHCLKLSIIIIIIHLSSYITSLF